MWLKSFPPCKSHPYDVSYRTIMGILTSRNSDSVFYFSYLQPAPKGNVLDLWANADELATVNG